ncbi:MAG: bifunctional folylpolyglutamate synthase/dihydrofolate synthase [Clostridioides sp.]|jgi:dihydrofolate synthase/folylpolyglutamate synthase|nr:bifunctional folylpolyglutamate synthase/dihydrofolate synthase [Clostridioides sp.]
MEYSEALEYISSTNRFGVKLGLETVAELLKLLGNPQDDLKIIHVAGTNGKGSVCSFISNIIKEGGYNVGLYTSPYLERFTERIRVNGEEIPDKDVADIVGIIKEKIEIMTSRGLANPTEFEIVTAMAFYYFKMKETDYVVLEVGLGGRYDATNVIEKPLVSVITSISMDHVAILGDTLGKIAYEKAGIVKKDGSVVVYKQKPEAENVIRTACVVENADYIEVNSENISIIDSDLRSQTFDFMDRNVEYKGLEIRLIGEHQVKNAAVAIRTVEFLKVNNLIEIDETVIRAGLVNTRWPGRIEIMREDPLFIIDGAHNLDGAKSLAKVLEDNFGEEKHTLIIGMLNDKDVDGVIEVLSPHFDRAVVTLPISDRSMDVEPLKHVIGDQIPDVELRADIEEAVKFAVDTAVDGEVIVGAGSLYMIGVIRSYLKKG